MSWVSFATGARLDLAHLGRACRERGIWFVVDAIQGLGAAVLDVKACHIDILANGTQKWLLSPWGTGFAYVRRELVAELDPPTVGWLSLPASADFTRFLDYDLTYYPDARKFEVFTAPMHDLKAMDASLGLFLELGPAAVEAHVASLADHVVAWCEGRGDVRLITPKQRARRAGLMSIAVDDLPARARGSKPPGSHTRCARAAFACRRTCTTPRTTSTSPSRRSPRDERRRRGARGARRAEGGRYASTRGRAPRRT